MADRPAYDLMVLIDSEAPEERRDGILSDIKNQIAGGDGELKGDADWGTRRLAYEIDHRSEAYYHLFQLEAGPELLKQLEHSLSIDDAVLRHRFLKLPKGAPETTPRPEAAPRHVEAEGDEHGAPRRRSDRTERSERAEQPDRAEEPDRAEQQTRSEPAAS
jgi:small subunit ribosomal protein S6